MTLWFIPAAVKQATHRHPGQHVELTFLWGKAMCNRIRPDGVVESARSRWLRPFSTPDGYHHFFTERCGAILYLNVTRWLDGKPRHPRDGFELKETHE